MIGELVEKHVRLSTGRERTNDVLALYELKTRARSEAEAAGIVTEASVFPLSIGFSYITERKNVWILKMKYHTYKEWQADCEDYIWEFQICPDSETGELLAVRPCRLPSGKIVCCIFAPFAFKEYAEFHPVMENDVCSVVNSLLDLLYLESVVEYEGRLYISSKDMFVIGTPLSVPQHGFLFDKQLYYKTMIVGKDVPRGACVEMLHRSMKLSMEWERKSDSELTPLVLFKNYVM